MIHLAKSVVITAVLLVLLIHVQSADSQTNADRNLFPPVFKYPEYVVSVKEQIAPYKPVAILSVSASDADVTSPNNQITYSILQAGDDQTIAIAADTGMLYDFGVNFSQVQQGGFKLTVMARDGGTPAKNSTAAVMIKVYDSNETPRCKNSPSELTAKDGTMVDLKDKTFQGLECSDPDIIPEYKLINYQLLGASGLKGLAGAAKFFKVNATTGEIQIIYPLPANQYSYQLYIRVGDKSNDPRYVNETVNLVIKGLRPTCAENSVINLYEAPSCSIITPCTSPYENYIRYTVKAKSAANQAWVKNMLTFTDLYGALEICKEKGTMPGDKVSLSIEGSVPAWTHSTPAGVFLTIEIFTSIVYTPSFSDRDYQASTKDDTAIGSTVFQVKPTAAKQLWVIMEPSCRFFSVAQQTWHVSVYKPIQGLPLGKTSCKGFLWGETNVSARANLVINITDTNSAPVCDQSQSVHIMYTNTRSNGMTPVVGLQCQDKDFTRNNTKIFYELLPILDYNYFKLSGSQLFLKTWDDLPRYRSAYNIVYRAMDSLSSSPMTATATLNVQVTGLPRGCPTDQIMRLSDQQPCTGTFLPCSGATKYSLAKEEKLLNFTQSEERIKICVVSPTNQDFTTTAPLKASILDKPVPFNVTIRYTYTSPNFSKKSYQAYVYAGAKAGTVVLTVSATAVDGTAVLYSCSLCTDNPYWALNARTGVITLERKIPMEGSSMTTTTISVTASDTSRRRSSADIIVTILADYDPKCIILRQQVNVGIQSLGRLIKLASISCPVIKGIELKYALQIQSLHGEQYLSFSGSSSLNSTSMIAGSKLSLYLTPGLPQRRANYTSRVVVSGSWGARASSQHVYQIAYNVSVDIRPPYDSSKVSEDTITIQWSWPVGEYSKEASTRFVNQISHIQVTWQEVSETVKMTPQSRNLTNTAKSTTLSSLKANTTYSISLLMYNVDSFYPPLLKGPLTVKTADPYMYEVLLLENRRLFTLDHLDKTSTNYQDTVRTFKPGSEMDMERFQDLLTGFLSLTFKYFRRGSIVAGVNIALNRNIRGSNASLYSTGLKIFAGILRITEQGKGSVRMLLPMAMKNHTSHSRNLSVHVQLEGRPSEVNCSAEVFGPETPVFKWSLGAASVLNISTTRVYFSKYWQNEQGYYVSTLFFKEIIPRDSGIIACSVELTTQQSLTSLNVSVLPKPVMDITPMTAVVKKGGSVVIKCSATYPTVDSIEKRLFQQIQWKKDNIVLENAEVIHHYTDLTRFPAKSSITVTSLEKDTKVTCIGTNDAGTSEATTSITVDSGSKLCKAERDGHEISWSDTRAGESDTQRCMKGYKGKAYRKCIEKENTFEWGKPNLVQCVSTEMESIYLESMDLAEGIDKSTVEVTSGRLRDVTAQTRKVLVSGDLLKTVSIIENLVTAEEIRNSSTDLTEVNIIESASNILEIANKDGWADVQEEHAGTSLLMKNLDRYGQTVSGRHAAEKWRVVPSKNIVLQTKKAKITTAMASALGTNKIVFPDPGLNEMTDWANNHTQLSIEIKSVARVYGDDEVGMSGLQYKTLNVFLPGNESAQANSSQSVNTDILALSIVPAKGAGVIFDPPIRLRFRHINSTFSNASCSFWDFSANTTDEMRKNAGAWSTSGCRRIESESDTNSTTCECNHLTNFAILMSPSKVTHPALDYISWIGCGVSIACLLATIIIYAVYWKHVKSDRSVILLNLCVALILALTIFLAGVERRENKYVCTAVAALLHYFFLAVFCFMLMEGIELYILLVRIFHLGSSRTKWYMLCGWGVPAILVAISLGATQASGYGNEDYCWLSIDNGLLWAFVAPALAIILINCVFLGLAMKAMFSTQAMEAKSTVNKVKQGVRGLCILMPLLGISWIFGVLAVNDDTLAFQYVFTILNSLQGVFIFIFHSLMNKQLLKKWKEARRSSTGSSSGAKPMKPRTPNDTHFSKHFKKHAAKDAKQRKASLPTEEMQFGYSSSTSDFKPAPELGMIENRAFENDFYDNNMPKGTVNSLSSAKQAFGEPISVDHVEYSIKS